jgi:hypothetical protein
MHMALYNQHRIVCEGEDRIDRIDSYLKNDFFSGLSFIIVDVTLPPLLHFKVHFLFHTLIVYMHKVSSELSGHDFCTDQQNATTIFFFLYYIN